MDSSIIEKILTEFAQHQSSTAPILEGFSDATRVGLVPHALATAQDGIQAYTRRLQLLEAAIVALTELQEDGYPLLPRFIVSQEESSNFQDQLDSMQAALAQLDVEEPAVSGVLTFDDE